MKKVFALLLVPLLAFVLFACGSVPADPATSSTAPDLSSPPAITAPDSSEIPSLPDAPEPDLSEPPVPSEVLYPDPAPEASSENATLNAQGVVATTAFVNPLTGLDSNAGTTAKPFKTIRRALTGAKAGLTITLSAGLYNAASGEPYGYTVPDGVNIKGKAGVFLFGNLVRYGFRSLGTSTFQDLDFSGFAAPIFISGFNKDTVSLTNLTMNSVGSGYGGLGILHTGSATLRVTNSVFLGDFSIAIRLGGRQDGTQRPKLVVQGGKITGAVAGIYSRLADVTINGLVTNKIASSSLFMSDGSTAVVTGAKFSSYFNISMDGNGPKLKVRSSQFLGTYPLYARNNFLEIDLGKSSADPGRNDFSSAFKGILLFGRGLKSARTVFAVGNRWKPNVQGSDASGKFIGFRPVCPSSSISGKNFNLYVTPGAPQLCLVL